MKLSSLFIYLSIIVIILPNIIISIDLSNTIRINEICTNNKESLKDSYGKYPDWIELYNPTNVIMDITGYGLSDIPNAPFRYKFPQYTIIGPKKYLTVFASRNLSTKTETHIGFSLNKNGETLYLTHSSGELIEKIEVPALEEDQTYGRLNTKNSFTIMRPTPSKENAIIISPPEFSEPSGFYQDEFELKLSSKDDTVIYYTTDGSDPLDSKSAKIYEEPINIYDRSSEPNIYAEYDATDPDSPLSVTTSNSFRREPYRKPNYLLDKAMIVRAATKNEDGFSDTIDKTYFITNKGLSKYKNFTIVSLVSSPKNLFDPDTGIYVVGNEYIEWKNSDEALGQFFFGFGQPRGNFNKKGKEWERRSNIAIFENGKLIVDQNVGIRTKGFSTRNNPGKGFNVIARKKYGKSTIVSETLLPNNLDINGKQIKEYKSISLRCIGAEDRIADVLGEEMLHNQTEITTLNMRKSILFLNGEYWGLYIILEHLTQEFFGSNYNLPAKYVSLLKDNDVEEGPEEDTANYIKFVNETSKKDFSNNEMIEEVNKFIDINSFLEHYVCGLYVAIVDWPNHNYGAWRYNGEEIEGNKYTDGRWRFVTYDLDFSMGVNFGNFGGQGQRAEGYEYDPFNHLYRNNGIPTVLFKAMLNNIDFRNRFLNLYMDYGNEIANINKMQKLVKKYMDEYIDLTANSVLRWSGYNGTEEEGFEFIKKRIINNFWEEKKKFFDNRAEATLKEMKTFYKLKGGLCEIKIKKNGNGVIHVNDITPEFDDNHEWSGKYFSDIPIIIKAVNSENCVFKEWSGDVKSKEKVRKVYVEEGMEISADYECE